MGFGYCLFELDGEGLEVFVLRTGANEDFILAWLYAHGVGLWFERDARAGAVDEDDLLASLFEGFEEIALHLGENTIP